MGYQRSVPRWRRPRHHSGQAHPWQQARLAPVTTQPTGSSRHSWSRIGGHCMKAPRTLVALTMVNLVLLLLGLARQMGSAGAEGEPPVLRGRALEIVDAQGRVRASISVLPPGESRPGEEAAETVLLRLITERGRPTVKIASSEPQSGLSFAGPTGTKDTYVVLEAKGTTTSLKLRAEDGHEQVLKP